MNKEQSIQQILPTQAGWPRPLEAVPAGHRARPAQLYWQGTLPGRRPALAIIGTRQFDELMNRRLEIFGEVMAGACPQVSVVSGLALGCDKKGHEVALAHGLHTTAVMPVGLDMVVPRQHASLARQILAKGGCLVSTREVGTPVTGFAYVSRDWVQSAMADALLLTATGVKGGSWHATRETAALGRPLAWLQAPEDGGEAWEGNRQLSRALAQARAGQPGELQRLLGTRDARLHERCAEISGKRTAALWLARALPQAA